MSIRSFLKDTWAGLWSPVMMNGPELGNPTGSRHRAGFGGDHKILTGHNMPEAHVQTREASHNGGGTHTPPGLF